MGTAMTSVNDRPDVPLALAAHIMSMGTAEGMARIEVGEDSRDYWKVGHDPIAASRLSMEVSVTLSAHQWAAVLGMVRISAGIGDPAIPRLAHDEIMAQLRAAVPGIFKETGD